MSIVRAPSECIKAVLANLQYAEDAARTTYQNAPSSHHAAEANGEGRAYREAIALIRTECQSILEENQ